MLKLSKPQSSHEELFMQRYERLRAWALRLVVGDQLQADDLLHDAFIHFTLHRSLIENVQNLDAYLHTMLRNLHLSQARRLARTPQGHLSLLDYDLADIGLQSIDPRDQIKVHDELRMIGRYSCIRKQTSKAGSVLILRFFHGYYPAEIARILNCPRAAVDSLLKGARGEAKLFLQNPEGLTFIRDTEVQDLPTFSFGRVAPDILAELRHTIFSSGFSVGRERCVPFEKLQATYSEDATDLVDVATLNHLVSCERCLDEVNKLLDLPLLGMRQASETTGRDNRPKGDGGGPSGTGSAGPAFLKRSRRRTKHVYEHQPKELHISVNGFVLGTQTISSRRSELTLNVNLGEKIAFVEVFSERDVRLFFLNVEVPPEGPVDQLSSIELSEGRELELALNFSDTWPRLHAVYVDPRLAEVGDTEAIVRSPTSNAQSPSGSAAVNERSDSGLLTKMRQRFRDLGSKAKDFRPWTWDLGLFSRPAVVTLLLAAILVGSLFILRIRNPGQPVTAANVLQQASANERAVLAKTNQVIHQTITLEERKSPGGDLIAQRRIEVWQSPARGITARRLYDERGQLIAGDWRRADGVQTLYHHGKRPQLQLDPERRGSSAVALTFNDAWQLSPSAKEISALIADGYAARVEERPAQYVINYTRSANNNASKLLKATIVLSRPDLHAIEETLTIAQGEEQRDFRLTEISFEQRAPNAVAPAVFDPEVELLGGLTKTRDEVRNVVSPSTGVQPLIAVVATAATEVEVLKLLSVTGADMGEQVSVTRTPEGHLRIDGLVETAERKAELLRALQPVRANPAVQIKITTVAEALSKQKPASQSTPTEITLQSATVGDSIPAFPELRRYFTGKSQSQDEVEQSIRRYATRMTTLSYGTVQRAMALKRLAGRFSADELRTMDAEARNEWLALIRNHARTLQQQVSVLSQELRPVFPNASGGGGEDLDIRSDTDLIAVADRLFALCASYDDSIHRALTLSSDTSGAAAIKSPQFWRSLQSAEKLSAKIGQYRH